MKTQIEKDAKLVREFLALMADKPRYAKAKSYLAEREAESMSPKKFKRLSKQQQEDFISGAKSARDINININIQGGN